MKTLITFLTIGTFLMTVETVVATVNSFGADTSKTNTSVAPAADYQTFTNTMYQACIEEEAILPEQKMNCQGEEVYFSKEKTFVFMDEVYPNNPDQLFTTPEHEGFYFMDTYIAPIPEDTMTLPNPKRSRYTYM